MKVIQINGVASAGSTGKIVTQLSEVMHSEGIENYIISAGYKETTERDNVYFCSSYIGVRTHQILGNLLGDTGFHSYLATRKAISILKKNKPDVVHLHNIYSYFLNVETLLNYLKTHHITTIWTIHDFWAVTGHCTHFEVAGCYRWKKECGNCPQLRKFPYSRFFDRSATLLNKKKSIYDGWNTLYLATVSEWVANYLPDSILKGKEIRIIPNGVDTSVFKPLAVEKPYEFKEKFVILSVAMSWGANKGLNDLLSLASKMNEDELLVIIGLPEDKIDKLPTNVIGIPRTKNADELCNYYNIADVYVSASTEETMGLTVVEAMACGTPAVVYNKTALPELIADGCGYICRKTVDELYCGIQKIRTNGKAYYTDNCVKHARENYDKWNQYRKYCSFYYDCMRKTDENKYKQ
jgi:putative colanic acid biosynthesis glycosyltransferase